MNSEWMDVVAPSPTIRKYSRATPEIHNDFNRSKLEILRRMNARQNLPAGIHLKADGAISVNVEELQVGMKPVVINHPSGVMRVRGEVAIHERTRY